MAISNKDFYASNEFSSRHININGPIATTDDIASEITGTKLNKLFKSLTTKLAEMDTAIELAALTGGSGEAPDLSAYLKGVKIKTSSTNSVDATVSNLIATLDLSSVLGQLSSGQETDPVWTQDKNNYYTKLEINNLYSAINEIDPVYSADKPSIALKTEVETVNSKIDTLLTTINNTVVDGTITPEAVLSIATKVDAVEEKLSNLFVVLTQDEYNALETKQQGVLYLIKAAE